MKTLSFITLIAISIQLSGNSPEYIPVLEASLIRFEKDYGQSACRDLANTCERIIALEKTEWMPYYYKAYAMVHLGFMTKDEELNLYRKRGCRIELRKIDLVYYARPAFAFQELVFPALRVFGSVLEKSGRGNKGFEFARFFHAVPAKEYARVELFADYLAMPI